MLECPVAFFLHQEYTVLLDLGRKIRGRLQQGSELAVPSAVRTPRDHRMDPGTVEILGNVDCTEWNNTVLCTPNIAIGVDLSTVLYTLLSQVLAPQTPTPSERSIAVHPLLHDDRRPSIATKQGISWLSSDL